MSEDRLERKESKIGLAALEQAEVVAGQHGLSGFCAWRMGLERRYTIMPPWYWDDQKCKRHYIAHIRAAIDWQRRESRINLGNADFHRTLVSRPKAQ